ncbi:hypothetical protein [uncultured Methanobrevibacter sp.]|uniref:hypothetical protein n=1 Tax=uncultured Methanobrevibacter sp. TaxID=253161 RepID=UPI0025D75E36|nr:hypothetical protein [uncultured Methanobrevibacter sp.]
MEFHEDVIFKSQGQVYGRELMDIIKIEGKIVEVHQTEYGIIDPKMYKPDMVFELEDRIVILEFQSTYVDISDKRRFRLYSALFDHLKNKSQKDIEVHVLSTVEAEKTKCYKINPDSSFLIYIHSLKSYDGDEFLNMINTKISNNQQLSEKELLLISLICFMDNRSGIEYSILNSAVVITNVPDLDKDIAQFVKGVVLMLCDKFVVDESLNMTISNLVGGNMKIVEDYAQRVAQRKVDEKLKERDEEIVRNMDEKGVKKEDIAILANVSLEFVEKTLSK